MIVAVLCNPQPPLTTVQDIVGSYWSQVGVILQETAKLHPLNVPISLHFESEIEAFLLLNLDSQTSLTSLRPSGLSLRTTLSAGVCVWSVCEVCEYESFLNVGFKGEMSQERKVKYLCRWFKSTVSDILPLTTSEGSKVTSLRERVSHKILETYCHAKVPPSHTHTVCEITVCFYTALQGIYHTQRQI